MFDMVPHCPVPPCPPLLYGAALSVLAMSTPAIWCRVVQSRDVSPHNFDGLAMSSSAFSVAPLLDDADHKALFLHSFQDLVICHMI